MYEHLSVSIYVSSEVGVPGLDALVEAHLAVAPERWPLLRFLILNVFSSFLHHHSLFPLWLSSSLNLLEPNPQYGFLNEAPARVIIIRHYEN